MNSKTYISMFCLAFLCLGFYSCGSHVIREKAPDGKFYKRRVYRTHELEVRRIDKWLFKNKKDSSYIRYAGSISSDTIPGYKYFQHDSFRIYLAKYCLQYQGLFDSGLVSSQLLYSALGYKPHPYMVLMKPDGTKYITDYYGWEGYVILIGASEIKYLRTPGNRRRFTLFVNTGKGSMISGRGQTLLVLELKNTKANKHTPIEDFIQGARVTFIKQTWDIF